MDKAKPEPSCSITDEDEESINAMKPAKPEKTSKKRAQKTSKKFENTPRPTKRARPDPLCATTARSSISGSNSSTSSGKRGASSKASSSEACDKKGKGKLGIYSRPSIPIL